MFLKDGQAYSTKNWMFTNADFLKVVNLPLIAGTTLPAPQTAVLDPKRSDQAVRHRPGRRPHADDHLARHHARLSRSPGC